MTTLLVGATGLLGPEICQRLKGAGREVRALIRPTSDASKRTALQALGVELVEGDLKEPASLARACASVDAVISTASSTLSRQAGDSIETVDHLGQLALIDAARQADVDRFVFVSFRENPNIQFPLTVAKRAVEQALKSSSMAYTIIQASYFMEVWLSPALGFDVANHRVRFYGDGEQPISWISYRDVARAAADAVIEDVARREVVELGGPEALSPKAVVRMFEVAGAGAIATDIVPVSALQHQLATSTDSLEQSFAGLMLQYAAGDSIVPARSGQLFPFQRGSVREFITSQRSLSV